MAQQPQKYRLNDDCAVSTPQLASLVFESNPVERERIVQKARFPLVQTIVQYAESKREIRRFLARNDGDTTALAEARDHFDSLHEAETNEHVKLRHRLNRDAITAFLNQLSIHNFGKFDVVDAPSQMSTMIEGVRVKTTLDALFQWTNKKGSAFSGGLMVFPAQSDTARQNIEERRTAMATLIHWSLKAQGSNLPPAAKICSVLDLADGQIVSSPETYARLATRIEASCRYFASTFGVVAPPANYDGPLP